MIGDILQPTHLLFILVIALLVLGPKRLPEVGRSLGRGLRDFKVALSGEETRDEVMAPATTVATVPAPVVTQATVETQPDREPAQQAG